jgi:predicted RNA-binding Zn ribbon-like protein
MAFESMQLVKLALVETVAVPTQNPRELPIVGGHLALDFANTVDDPEGPERYDHAGTYPELVGWSVRIGVLTPDQADELLDAAIEHPLVCSLAMRRAHALRRILIDTFTEIAMINSGEPAGTERLATEAHWADLRPFVTDAMAHAELAPDDSTYRLTWPETSQLDAMLWPIGLAALDLLISPQLSRLKKCAGCPWVFLDQSKNLSRRWCAMSDCGTHEKIRRYVTRRAAKKRV